MVTFKYCVICQEMSPCLSMTMPVVCFPVCHVVESSQCQRRERNKTICWHCMGQRNRISKALGPGSGSALKCCSSLVTHSLCQERHPKPQLLSNFPPLCSPIILCRRVINKAPDAFSFLFTCCSKHEKDPSWEESSNRTCYTFQLQ